MERVESRLTVFAKALATLEDILKEVPGTIVRDATIQRFEYTFEAGWKALKAVLEEREGLTSPSPKSAFRNGLKAGLLTPDETETCLRMCDDRNLTSHTYLAAVAERLFAEIPAYAAVLRTLCDRAGRSTPS